MNTMKRLQILEPGRAVWRDAPIPQPVEGEALIKEGKVAALLFAGGDGTRLKSKKPKAKF